MDPDGACLFILCLFMRVKCSVNIGVYNTALNVAWCCKMHSHGAIAFIDFLRLPAGGRDLQGWPGPEVLLSAFKVPRCVRDAQSVSVMTN